MIQANGIHLIYKDGTKALNEIGFSIGVGELCYITGPSGSGKTSLLKLLLGIEFPTEGSLVVLGQSIEKGKERSIRKMRQELGPIFQEFRLIQGKTALENVVLGMRFLGWAPGLMKEEATKALIRVGLEHKINARVENMSWGECQRVAIARAVARKPRLILADEPTGNLDHDNALNILELLSSFRDEKTAVVITTHATHLIEDHKEATHIYMTQGNMRMERPVRG